MILKHSLALISLYPHSGGNCLTVFCICQELEKMQLKHQEELGKRLKMNINTEKKLIKEVSQVKTPVVVGCCCCCCCCCCCHCCCCFCCRCRHCCCWCCHCPQHGVEIDQRGLTCKNFLSQSLLLLLLLLSLLLLLLRLKMNIITEKKLIKEVSQVKTSRRCCCPHCCCF